MSTKIPDHIISQYGSARAFRAEKRRIVKEMKRLASQLATGCAYLPNGARGVGNIEYELRVLTQELSVKAWGR